LDADRVFSLAQRHFTAFGGERVLRESLTAAELFPHRATPPALRREEFVFDFADTMPKLREKMESLGELVASLPRDLCRASATTVQ